MGVQFIRAAEIAAEQHGRITTQQLYACGVSKKGIERAVQAGRLHRLQRNVYALGHLAPTRESEWMTAVLACQGWLSDACAACAFGFHASWGPRVDVTVQPNTSRHRDGVRVRRRILQPFEVTTWRKIPITSPSRTMVDLAHELRDVEGIEWALRQLQYQRLYVPSCSSSPTIAGRTPPSPAFFAASSPRGRHSRSPSFAASFAGTTCQLRKSTSACSGSPRTSGGPRPA